MIKLPGLVLRRELIGDIGGKKNLNTIKQTGQKHTQSFFEQKCCRLVSQTVRRGIKCCVTIKSSCGGGNKPVSVCDNSEIDRI